MSLVNVDRLDAKLKEAGIDVLLAVAPENTYYLSGVFIRTQVSIRDRLAAVIWPRDEAPTFVVCNIEESLARKEGSIDDVRTYVEHEESPIGVIMDVLSDRGFDTSCIGIEFNYLFARPYEQLKDGMRNATFVAADDEIESVRSVKTPAETERITAAFLSTEDAIREAWGDSRAGDTEKTVADRMLSAMLSRGASGLRHITLASGENSVHAHMTPGARELRQGDTILTDVGGHFSGFASDMARMGIVGPPSAQRHDEYSRYQQAYVALLNSIRPGITAAGVYRLCQREFTKAGLELTSPHVGHSLTRMGGHENPILHPRCEVELEPGMLLAIEPSYRPRPDQRYHLEDLVVVTESGAAILTDWQSTERMIEIGL